MRKEGNMSGLNDMFNEFPDYDVFTGETEPVKKRRRKPKPIRENTRDPEDYGDGFGIYVERKEYTRNFITVFYFLILILFLELVLRLSLLESFGFNSLLYTFTLSVPISAVLTFICTLFSQKVNRILSNIFTFIICFWFAFQLLYRVAEKHFFTFSKPSPIEFDALWKALTERGLIVAVMLVPFVFNLLVGGKVFAFRRIRIPAKVTLLLVAALFQLTTMTMISLSKHNPYVNTSYNLYNLELDENEAADRFGLLTTQRLDIVDIFIK